MAIAQQTELLLLDEPTTFLDIAHQIDVLDLTAALNRFENRTVVVVLHDLHLACRYAHHVVAIRRVHPMAGHPQHGGQRQADGAVRQEGSSAKRR